MGAYIGLVYFTQPTQESFVLWSSGDGNLICRAEVLHFPGQTKPGEQGH